MLARIEHWLPLSIRQNEDDLRLARILLMIIVAAVFAFLLAILSSSYGHPGSIPGANIVGLVLLGIPLGLLKRGKLQSSAIFLALHGVGVITYAATVGRGIQDVAFTAYPIIVLFAALVMPRNYFLFFVALTNIAVGWVSLATSLSWFAARPVNLDVTTDTVTVMTTITISAFIAYLLAETIRQNLARAHQEIAERKRTETALRESEEKYRLLTNNTSDVIWILDLETLRFRYVSPSVERLRGYSVEEVMAQDISHALTPRSAQYLEQNLPKWISDFQSGVFQPLATEIEQPCKDGTTVWTEIVASIAANNDNGHLEVYGVSRDITVRRRTEAQLRQLSRAVEQSPVSIVITDTHGTIEYVNPKFTEVTGYTLDEARGQNPRILKSGEIPSEGYTALWDTILAGKEWRGEFHNKKKNGELYWESASISAITNSRGEITHFIAIKEDITARKHTESQLYYLSTHDVITGLYNRAHFEAELERLEHGRLFPISIIVSDIDHMKTVNDSLGHAAGDELLERIAFILRSAFRASDIIARIGGDEFAILLPETDALQADQALARVKEKSAECQIVYPNLPLSLSSGAATSEGSSLEETFKLADRRMYADKRARKQNDT